MKFINTSKGFYPALQIVAFLAILLFSGTSINAQEVSLKVLKSDKMFIGVDNLVQVSVPGVPSEKIHVASDGINIERLDNGIFKIGVGNPGKVTLTVHGEGFKYKNFDIDVKHLPDPVAQLKLEGGQMLKDGEISVIEFRKAMEVSLNLPEYQGQAPFAIASCSMVYVPKVGDPIEVPVQNGQFGENAKKLIKAANSGDTYYFEEVKISSPFGEPSRQLNSMVYRIK